MTNQIKIRDFIYMDVERLKSILAQVNAGLPEQRSKTFSESEGEDRVGEGGITGILKMGGTNKYLWQTTSTESQTLHDYIYNFVERELRKEELIFDINEEVSPSDVMAGKGSEKISHNSFIIVRGRTLINNFTYMKGIFDNFNEMQTAFIDLEASNMKSPEKKKYVDTQRSERVLSKELHKSIGKLLEVFYKDRNIIKLIPFREAQQYRFAGPLKENCLREDINEIIYKYTTSPNHDWTMFAQVSSIPSPSVSDEIAIHSSNEMEAALDGIFLTIRQLERTGLSISYPEIAVTPIAIYRE